jgi:AcrR family transcriptional regulator
LRISGDGGDVTSTEASRPAPTKRPKNRKAQIALVAAELFCERGYHLVGVDEIAAAVGITGPAVYRHFPNKYAVLIHATRELSTAIEAAVDAALEPADDPRDQLDRVLTALAALCIERRKVGGLYQWENRYLTPEHRAEFRAGLAALISRVAAPLAQLRPELSTAEARVLTRAAFSAIGSLATHRAPISRLRTDELLRRAGWALLTAAPPKLAPAASEPVEPAAGVQVTSRREILLAEAIRLFNQHGYHAVGIEDIGRAAGINASSVYRYFPSKSDLLAAAYYRAAERLSANTTASLGAADGFSDALRRLVGGFTDLTFHQRDLVAVYLAENNNLPESDRHELRKIQRLQVEEWVRLLTGVRPELAAAEARILAHAALNLVTDLGGSTDPLPPAGFEPVVASLAVDLMLRA